VDVLAGIQVMGAYAWASRKSSAWAEALLRQSTDNKKIRDNVKIDITVNTFYLSSSNFMAYLSKNKKIQQLLCLRQRGK